MRVVLHPNIDAEILGMPGVRADSERRADRVVKRAAQDAPKLTGAGARSIHAEPLEENGKWEGTAVSWDAAHNYMLFAEVGTEHEVARPFLRPALEAGSGPSE